MTDFFFEYNAYNPLKTKDYVTIFVFNFILVNLVYE